MGPLETIGIVLASWAVAALVQWGIFGERLRTHSARIKELEQNAITRKEYEARHVDMREWLSRVEGKLDKALSAGRHI